MSAPVPDLRAVIADVVREVVADLATDRARMPAPSDAGQHPGPPRPDGRTQAVRISDDTDLDRFTRQLLTLFENPKNRQDLRSGRLRFRLEGGVVASSSDRPVERIETGAVTERQVKAAARDGRRLLLGRRAVLTPLGRERARDLGVPIEKER